jgi:hypothetical protein
MSCDGRPRESHQGGIMRVSEALLARPRCKAVMFSLSLPMAGQCAATAFVSPHNHRPLFNQIQAMHACMHAHTLLIASCSQAASPQPTPMYLHVAKRENSFGRKEV